MDRDASGWKAVREQGMTTTATRDRDAASNYRSEFMEQPQRLKELFSAYGTDLGIREELRRLVAAISNTGPVVWTGMGASFCSALAASTLLSVSGWPSFAVESSEFLHYAAATWSRLGGLILISTSGESAELVSLAKLDSSQRKILLCNNDQSPCWSAAEIRLPIRAGIERANATKTYTNSTAACAITASELVGQAWQSAAAKAADAFSSSLQTVLDERQAIEKFARNAVTIEIIGRGAALGGARYGALCLREMTQRRASAHSGGGFRHGPLLDVDSSHLAIILALGRTGELGDRLAKDCLAKKGRVVLATDDDLPRPEERLLPVKIDKVPEGWEGLTAALVPQALTMAHIERHGSQYVRVQTIAE
ncbi:MAG: SIS domain-containing protein [Terriglobia bacterium]